MINAAMKLSSLAMRGHPEVIGTMGQLADNVVKLIETVEDVEALAPKNPDNLAWITQTTLSVDDTADIIAALKRRFPAIKGPNKNDICYATTNRQEAVKQTASRADVMIVVGAPNSSNSKRLREVGERAGCRQSLLLQRASEIDWDALGDISSVCHHRRGFGSRNSGGRSHSRLCGAL